VLTLSNVPVASPATYSVLVTNALGSAASAGALLTINSSPPVIAKQPASQTVLPGATATFSVTASGNLPLSYQWQFNGAILAGATNSTLTLPAIQPADAGNYSVCVSNNLGSVASAAAGLKVPARLCFTQKTNGLTLSWSDPCFLQSSTNVIGPYFDVPGAVSPYIVVITSGPPRFFRLRAPTAGLVEPGSLSGNGQFQLTVAGLPGYNYIVQASTNLTVWTPLQTNPAPFLFLDTNAWQYPRRFYRTVFAP
jgi:hypothetical protein